MLKQLRIENFILMERVEISFEKGFHVFSGETGAGKSALLHALRLIGGERADATIVRHGASKGHVEAVFDLSALPEASELLRAAGIELDGDESEELLIRREVSSSGKSRAWINHQLAQCSLLKQLGTMLLQIVGQHASRRLQAASDHRTLLDTYGGLTADVATFCSAWELLHSLEQQLAALHASEGERLRMIEICRMEITEIDEARVSADEEDKLFLEYSLLAKAEERSTLTRELLHPLQEGQQAMLPRLHRLFSPLDQLQQIDPALHDTAAAFRTALLDLQEVCYELQRYSNRIDNNPDRLADLNSRLTLLNRLKKKYGGTCEAIISYGELTRNKLEQLEQTDVAIDHLEQQVAAQRHQLEALATQLTGQRRDVASSLASRMQEQLRDLNMPEAEFHILHELQPRCRSGNDAIEFFLQPNVGERKISLCDGASGGEVARVLLALHVLLAGKERTPTLIFDEIDANIGGRTATKIAEKLLHIAGAHQVVCITHFPQVAQSAQHHHCVVKQEREGRTISAVELLHPLAKRKKELARMSGGVT